MGRAEIRTMCVEAKNLAERHKVEIEVEFTEPVTYREAEQAVMEAVSSYLFDRGIGGDKDD